jgi:concentrative nucleoside transporter, CNT family
MSYLNAVSAVGLVGMIFLAWLMSSAKRQFPWRLVILGLMLQIVFAAVFFNSQRWTFPRTFTSTDELVEELAANPEMAKRVFMGRPGAGDKVPSLADTAAATSGGMTSDAFAQIVEEGLSEAGGSVTIDRYPQGIVFFGVQAFFDLIDRSVGVGKGFVFTAHPPSTDPKALIGSFAFGVLPTVVFFAALMSVLYYIGLMDLVVRGMAWIMQKTLRTSAAESLAAAANVFVGHTEAPLVIRPFVPVMTQSELNALMIGGFATISGSLMAIFAMNGISAGHLLTASIISAPAALLIAKVILPESETPVPVDSVRQSEGSDRPTNIIEAAAIGASEGMRLAINIAAMLIAFLALIAMFDILLGWIGAMAGIELSLKRIFGILFWPIALLMGIAPGECAIAGEVLGTKTVVNEFVAYFDLLAVKSNGLETGMPLSERTEVILIYALCGFSNFGAIGIQIGGIGALAPARRADLARLGLRAMFGGALACCMTACVAGLLYGIL